MFLSLSCRDVTCSGVQPSSCGSRTSAVQRRTVMKGFSLLLCGTSGSTLFIVRDFFGAGGGLNVFYSPFSSAQSAVVMDGVVGGVIRSGNTRTFRLHSF